ncbi:MAG: hypothetical protein FWG68_07585 [Defluviitaleaceae bacterium]|nr:hypothetical protein [Defluviitaleaceae bacterium]
MKRATYLHGTGDRPARRQAGDGRPSYARPMPVICPSYARPMRVWSDTPRF